MFLEKNKYLAKEKKISKIIIVNIEVFSDDSYNEDSNEKNSDDSDEESSDDNILAEKTRFINLFLKEIS